MGYSLYFSNGDERTNQIDYVYGYNLYRDVFDPVQHKGKTGTEMVVVLNKAIGVLHAKHPIRHSFRDLLKVSSGNLEILLKTLLETATKYPEWAFQVE